MTERRGIRGGLHYSAEAQPWSDINNDPAELIKSSLIMTVGLIEVLRGNLTHDTSKLSLPPSRHSPDFATVSRLAATPNGAVHLIKDDPEFERLWTPWLTFTTDRKGKALTAGYNAHARFLAANDVAPAAKVFAATSNFKSYVKELIHYGSPSHYFYRVLKEIKDGDMDKMVALSNNLYTLARWDETLDWLQDQFSVGDKRFWPLQPGQVVSDLNRSAAQQLGEFQLHKVESAARASDRFKRVSGSLFNILVASGDTSPFRKFITQYFPAVQNAVCLVSDPEDYDPEPEFRRIQDLFANTPEDKWQILANYILVSQWHFYRSARALVDTQMLKGETNRAETLIAYHKGFQGNDSGPFLTFNDNESEVLEHWVNQYAEGKISDEELLRVPANVRGITQAKAKLLKDIDFRSGFSSALENNLAQLRYSPAVALDNKTALLLLEQGIYPTDVLINFVREQGSEDRISRLRELQQATQSGSFDPSNPVQRDLEFLNFLRKVKTLAGVPSYQSFLEVSVVDDNLLGKELTFKQVREADAAAFEAANFYWFIHDRVQSQRRLAIIGNRRYGAYFVTEPLEPYFKELGVPVSTYYVHSGGNESKELAKVARLVREFIDLERIDDLVIVDGTYNPNSGKIPRLPTSLDYYRKMFVDKRTRIGDKDYQIAHWVPVPSDKIIVGREKPEDYNPPSIDLSPQIILANPVIIPGILEDLPRELRDHEPGYLDDPEKFERNKGLFFTSKGVNELSNGLSEGVLVQLVQERMASRLPSMLKITDPINRKS